MSKTEPIISVPARWLVRVMEGWPTLPDHACKDCAPYGEILVDGFQCDYHRAKAMLAAEQTKGE